MESLELDNSKFFTLIHAEKDAVHSSNGGRIAVAEAEWVYYLSDEDKKRVIDFLKGSAIGESVFAGGVLAVRSTEPEAERQLTCDCCY